MNIFFSGFFLKKVGIVFSKLPFIKTILSSFINLIFFFKKDKELFEKSFDVEIFLG